MRFNYALPVIKKGVKTMDDLEVIWLNEIDVEIFDDILCQKLWEDIVLLQNENNK